jgi:hypothetical protein
MSTFSRTLDTRLQPFAAKLHCLEIIVDATPFDEGLWFALTIFL